MIVTAVDAMTIPKDVLNYAEGIGVSSDIYIMIASAKQTMPDRKVTTYLSHDPDLPDETRIVIDIDVTGLPAAERIAARQRYDYILSDRCPSDRIAGAYVLRLSVEP